MWNQRSWSRRHGRNLRPNGHWRVPTWTVRILKKLSQWINIVLGFCLEATNRIEAFMTRNFLRDRFVLANNLPVPAWFNLPTKKGNVKPHFPHKIYAWLATVHRKWDLLSVTCLAFIDRRQIMVCCCTPIATISKLSHIYASKALYD